MCIVLVTQVVNGELGDTEKSRFADYAKAKAFAVGAAGAGCIVCVKRSGKVLFVA